MLTIRQAQLDALAEGRWRAFHEEVYELCRTSHPNVRTRLGNERLRLHVESAIRDARSYGFYLADDVRRYVSLTMTEGLEFDREPWAAEILDATEYYPSTRLDLLAWTAKNRRQSDEQNAESEPYTLSDATWPTPEPAPTPPPYILKPPDPSCFPPPPDADPGREY